MKDLDCRYVATERKWVVISPSALVLPESALKRVANVIRERWAKELGRLNPITDGTKMEFVRQALGDLSKIEQIFIGKGDIPVFTSTEGTGRIYG